MPLWLPQLVLTKAGAPSIARSCFPAVLSRQFIHRTTARWPRRNVIPNEAPAQLSSRKLKAGRQSPSHSLLEAAQALGVHLPPSRPYKLDLSYISARQADRRHRWSQSVQRAQWSQEQPQRLQTILARYILSSGPQHSTSHPEHRSQDDASIAENAAISVDRRAVLESRGYDLTDVKLWASIFCEPQIGVAATRLLAESGFIADQSRSSRKPLPVFLVLQLLRRDHVPAVALRSLLIYTACEVDRIRSSPSSHLFRDMTFASEVPHYPTVNESTMFILLVRLLRHVRQQLPEAIPTIGKLFIGYMEERMKSRLTSTTEDHNKRLRAATYLYNRMLSLLGLPSSLNPFHSVAFHQRAQFDLVQAMAKHDPPLQISKEGYRAVVNIQLATRKTGRERDWDSLKARSWPPWKEERTGFDAEKDMEYGTSRALTVLNRARDAGYGATAWSESASSWDRAASILTGWDVDASPTIQTRSFMRFKSRRRRRAMGGDIKRILLKERARADKDDLATIAVFAARIRATRTIREAWACFLALSNNNLLVPSFDVYIAMLEKLAFPPTPSRSGMHKPFYDDEDIGDAASMSSGDRKETEAEPVSPKELTYVSIVVPSFDELAMQMLLHGFPISSQCLSFLLAHTSSLAHGLKHVEVAARTQPELGVLLSRNEIDGVSPPISIISSFISFLCRFPSLPRQSYPPEDSMSAYKRATGNLPPLLHAIHLLQTLRIPVHAPWKAVLKTMASRRVLQSVGHVKDGRDIHFMHRWHLIEDLIYTMESQGLPCDAECFTLACRGLEAAVTAATAILEQPDALPTNETEELQPPPNTAEIHEEIHNHQAQPPPPTVNSHGASHDQNKDPTQLHAEATDLLQTSSPYIQDLFNKVMGTGSHLGPTATPTPSTPLKSWLHPTHTSPSIPPPRLLASPSAPLLHAYIRVLGLLHDWQGILATVMWMVKYQSEIHAAVNMPRNGARVLRRCVVAVRVFLEGHWQPMEVNGGGDGGGDKDSKADVAPKSIMFMVKRQIQGVEAWGGWATDREVEIYCRRDIF